VNGLHPYYLALEDVGSIDECLRQYIFDAIAEYRTSKMLASLNPQSTRRFKDDLLRAESLRVENASTRLRAGDIRTSMNAQQKN
jgi:hypothetical protein